MTSVTSLSGLTGLQNTQKTNSKLSAAINAIVSSTKIGASGEDIAQLSIAGQLQSATGALKQASSNIAQASTLAQVADGGIATISELAKQIHTLAQTAASPATGDQSRATLNDQFKNLVSQIDTLANNTSFNGQNLLNGSLSGAGAISLSSLLGDTSGSDDGGLSIDSLTSTSLFGGQSLSLATTGGAQNAFAVVGDALAKIADAQSGVSSFLQTSDYAAANIDTAQANQDAASSTLDDADFADATANNPQEKLQENAALALAAQGTHIPAALLSLVG